MYLALKVLHRRAQQYPSVLLLQADYAEGGGCFDIKTSTGGQIPEMSTLGQLSALNGGHVKYFAAS